MRRIDADAANWIGTLFVASAQALLAVFGSAPRSDLPEEAKKIKAKERSVAFRSAFKIFFAGTPSALLLYAGFVRLGLRRAVASSLAATTAAQAFTQEEARFVGHVVWLRAASALWNMLPRQRIDWVTHAAITTTFFGVARYPEASASSIRGMSNQFLGKSFFAYLQTDQSSEKPSKVVPLPPSTSALDALKESVAIFLRTFRGLIAYNLFLHLAAATISYLVRGMGRKAVELGKPVPTVKSFQEVIKLAVNEALVLNIGVSSSCALWFLGGRLPSSDSLSVRAAIGAFLAPLPLYAVPPRVRDTVYFLFMPWAARFVCNVPGSMLWSLDSRSNMVLGVAVIESVLRPRQAENNAAWLVSVGFSAAQRVASRYVADFR